jgi:beta-galactosidase
LPTRRKRRSPRTATSEGLDVEVDTETGLLSRLRVEGHELLTTAPRLALFRAPTDNDGLKLAPNQELKPLGRWQAWGLDRLERTVDRVRTKAGGDGRTWTVRARYAAADPDAPIRQDTTYLRDADGVVTISEDIRIPKQLSDLPRIGLAFEMPPVFEHLEWFGRGPHETYPDRKRGAAFGHYRSTVTDQYVPYVMPQEHGGHTDTRWFSLRDDAGRGLHVSGSAPFHFAVSHFSAADLTAATHDVELDARPQVFVNIDLAHRGLGTLSCGPDTLAQYRVGPGR